MEIDWILKSLSRSIQNCLTIDLVIANKIVCVLKLLSRSIKNWLSIDIAIKKLLDYWSRDRDRSIQNCLTIKRDRDCLSIDTVRSFDWKLLAYWYCTIVRSKIAWVLKSLSKLIKNYLSIERGRKGDCLSIEFDRTRRDAMLEYWNRSNATIEYWRDAWVLILLFSSLLIHIDWLCICDAQRSYLYQLMYS